MMENESLTHNTLMLQRPQVEKSVQALLEYVKKTAPVDFLDEPDVIHLQLCFKLVHTKPMTIRIRLPVTLARRTSDICLFVKDLDKKNEDPEPTILHYKELLEKNGISNIIEIIPLRTLKNEYGPYEAKRNLAKMFDIYLADESVMRLLPSRLGKSFYSRGRIPISINMGAVELKKHIDDAISSSNCAFKGKGSFCEAVVAHTAMSEQSIVENIVAAAQRFAERIPGGAANIRNLHIKTNSSVALPVYVSLTSADDVQLPKPPPKAPLDEPEEVTPITEGKVRVTPDGEIQIFPFDNVEEEESEADALMSTSVMKNRQTTNDSAEDTVTTTKQVKRKRMDDEAEDDDDTTQGKKMQKVDAETNVARKSPLKTKRKQQLATSIEHVSISGKAHGKKRKLAATDDVVVSPKGKKQQVGKLNKVTLTKLREDASKHANVGQGSERKVVNKLKATKTAKLQKVDKQQKEEKSEEVQKKFIKNKHKKAADLQVNDKQSKSAKPEELQKKIVTKVNSTKKDKVQKTDKKLKSPNTGELIKAQTVGKKDKNAKNVESQTLVNTKTSRKVSVKAPKKRKMMSKK